MIFKSISKNRPIILIILFNVKFITSYYYMILLYYLFEM